MAIPSWAVEALMRGVGNVVDKVPPEKLDQLKQRAGRWLDELPQSAARGVEGVMRSARAGKEMLDRWALRHVALVTPLINGSGTLCDNRIQGLPSGEGTIEPGWEAMTAPAYRADLALQRLHRRLNRCAGDEELSILVASSLDAACLAIGLSRRGRPLYLHRSQAIRLPSGTPVPDAMLPESLGGDLPNGIHEVGSIDAVSDDDAIKISHDAVLVAVDNGQPDALWYATALSGHHAGRVSLGDGCGRLRVVLMTACAGIRGHRDSVPEGRFGQLQPLPRTAADHLSPVDLNPRADLVILPGDGLLGGPPCGLIVGETSLIRSLAGDPLWRALEANIATTAMMTHALEDLQAADGAGMPVIQMLTTSQENLKNRAERLATRLVADDTVQLCQIGNASARVTASGPWQVPSCQLRLRHRDKMADSWAAELAEAVPAVLVAADDGMLQVDLRWVPPSDDDALAAALLGRASIAEQPSESAPAEVEVTPPSPS